MMSKFRTAGLAALVFAMAAAPALAAGAGAGGGAGGAGGTGAAAGGQGAGADTSVNNVATPANQSGVSDMQKTPGMNGNSENGGAQEGNADSQ